MGFFLTGQRAAFYMLLIESFFQKINVKNLRPGQGNTCWSVKVGCCQNSVNVLLFSRDSWQVHCPGLPSVQQISFIPPFLFSHIFVTQCLIQLLFSWYWEAFLPQTIKKSKAKQTINVNITALAILAWLNELNFPKPSSIPSNNLSPDSPYNCSANAWLISESNFNFS